MSRKPDSDGRQQDFFGVPEAEPQRPKPQAGKLPRAYPTTATEKPALPGAASIPVLQESDERALHDRLACLSPSEVRELISSLTDDALAQFTLATIRQLKRRLARESRYGSKGSRSSLSRAAQQLVAELGGQGGEDEF